MCLLNTFEGREISSDWDAAKAVNGEISSDWDAAKAVNGEQLKSFN